MHRHAITDEQWKVIEPFMTGKDSDPGATAQDNRQFINAVLWISKTGASWRDLPERLGNWHTQYTRFNRWAKAGRWQTIFEALQEEIDEEFLMIDSTIVRAHQHAAGAKGGR
jgi:transposase